MPESKTIWRSLWDHNDPVASEARFRELLVHNQKDLNLCAEVQTQIARSLGLQRRFEEARATIRELRPEAVRPRILYELELGRIENSSGNRPASIPHFKTAYELASRAGEDFLAVDAAHMLGIVEKPSRALVWNEKAIAEAEASTDELARGWLGSLYNNVGWVHHDQESYQKALLMFMKALDERVSQLLNENSPKNRENLHIARWCVARCFRSLGLIETALGIQQRLKAEAESRGNKPGFVYEEIAECLYEMGDHKRAKPYFAKAYKVLGKDEWLKAGEPKRLDRLQKLSRAG